MAAGPGRVAMSDESFVPSPESSTTYYSQEPYYPSALESQPPAVDKAGAPEILYTEVAPQQYSPGSGPETLHTELAPQQGYGLGYEPPPNEPGLPVEKGRPYGWHFEIGSSLLSIACTIAMTVLLFWMDGKPLSAWVSPVTPNAMISVLSTAAKSSMLLAATESISQLKWLHLERRTEGIRDIQAFDQASRGPLGAIKFVWLARRPSVLTYFGILVIVCAVGFDPFTQQLVSFADRPTIVPGLQSTVQRSQVYDNGNEGRDVVSQMGELGGVRDILMREAIIQGMYGLEKAMPFSCPGHTCNFPSFTSLGACSRCTNVTSGTTWTCSNAYNTNYGGPGQEAQNPHCNFTTPGNVTLTAYSDFDAHWGPQHTRINATIRQGADAVFGKDQFPVNITMMQFSEFNRDYTAEENADPTAWPSITSGMQAYECTISYCAHSFSNWSFTNGAIQPGEIRTVDIKSNPTQADFILTLPVTQADFPGNKTFKLGNLDTQNLYKILVSIFDFGPGNDYPLGTYVPSTASMNIQLALAQSPNLTDTIDKIAKGITHRMLTGPNSTTVHGDVMGNETFIQVHWPWLIAPLVLVVMSFIVLLAVVFATHRARQVAWKSSLTPLLLMGDIKQVDKGRTPTWTKTQRVTRAGTIARNLGYE